MTQPERHRMLAVVDGLVNDRAVSQALLDVFNEQAEKETALAMDALARDDHKAAAAHSIRERFMKEFPHILLGLAKEYRQPETPAAK